MGVNCIVETANKDTFAIPELNDSDVPLRLRANSPIVSLTPICNEEQLYPIDVDSVLDGDIKHCNAVKKHGPKPSFSRPLCPDDAGGSDENIVRQCVEKYAKRLPRDHKEQLIKLILKYREAFSLRELGRTTNFKYQLRFHPDAKFLHKQPYRSVERDLMKAEIEKMLKLGVIERCDRYVPSVCQASLLAKKDKSSRILVDLRQVNRNLQTDYFSYPNIDDLLCRIDEAKPKMFCMVDLSDSFFQLEIDEESRPYTAFTPYDGETFLFQTLPQGLSNNPS